MTPHLKIDAATVTGIRGILETVIGGSPESRGDGLMASFGEVMGLLLVDDHEAFRRSARVMLESEGFAVVGEAVDGASALAAARSLRPDVVLLDIRLPDMSGFAVAEELARDDPETAIVLISSVDPQDLGSRLTTSHVRGFLPKHELSGAALRDLLRKSA